MNQAVAYIRVSTEGQATHGVSLAAQEEKIGAWANLNNYTVVGRHVDAGISGGRADNRPGLQSALEKAKVAKVPFGSNLSMDGKWLEPNQAEQTIVEQIKALRSGGQSLRQIARVLEERGVKPMLATRWHPQVVLRLLERTEQAGVAA